MIHIVYMFFDGYLADCSQFDTLQEAQFRAAEYAENTKGIDGITIEIETEYD